MRAVIQRVLNASVTVQGNTVGSIERGLCVLVGITHDDTKEDLAHILRKVLTTRYWDDENGKPWSKNVVQIDGGVLLVSQFTLYSKFKGTKLDFHRAMEHEKAKEMFNEVVEAFKKEYKEEKIQTGEFGSKMKVNIVNDGPVTTIVDSRERDF